MPNHSFIAGVNLGGWLSQYRTFDKEHFDTFIRESDIERIASWGMDHVRLPVDYPVVEDDSRPGEYKEDGLWYIDQCLTWCRKYDLGLILDLHKAPGYSFNTLDSNTLFASEDQQVRYVRLWEQFAKRYSSEGDSLQLELLNEVVEPNSERWNQLAHRTIKAIREIHPTRVVIFGGNHYNSINELKNIELVENDEFIVYTFHFYLPHLFTHQTARWDRMTRLYPETVEYPGSFPNTEPFLRNYPEFTDTIRALPSYVNRATLEELSMPAINFMQNTGKRLYCGEYGVIDTAPTQSRINWLRDFVGILREQNIGRACWSYKAMNFGLVDATSAVVNDEIVAIVSAR